MNYDTGTASGAKVRNGSMYSIRGIECNKKNRRRLAEIGILEGSKIKVCGSNNKTVRVKVRDSFFALGTKVFKGLELEASPIA